MSYKEKINKIYRKALEYVSTKSQLNEEKALEIIDFYENVVSVRSIAFNYYKYDISEFLDLVDNCYIMLDEYIDEDLLDDELIDDYINEDIEDIDDIENIEDVEDIEDTEDMPKLALEKDKETKARESEETNSSS